MIIRKKIIKQYQHLFSVKKSGLIAIFVSARCKSKIQIQSDLKDDFKEVFFGQSVKKNSHIKITSSGIDIPYSPDTLKLGEDLKVEIDKAPLREIPPLKNIQLFNIPPSFNGSKLKGLKKTVIFLTVLNKGRHFINLIPKDSAFIEEIKIQELSGEQDIELKLEEVAEDGNNAPWHTFVLVDLPLRCLSVEITIKKQFFDSDDVKIIVDGKIKRNIRTGKYKYWYFVGGMLRWLVRFKEGQSKKEKISLNEYLDTGIHYIEFFSDRMPILHKVGFNLRYTETKAEKRAASILQNYASEIKDASREFKVNYVIVGSVIYQEQAKNVNFVDTLTDYIGGLLYINTSIGIGQVRVKTAESLEKYYSELCPYPEIIEDNMVRVERLKNPLTNIRYVAAKIKFSQERWGAAGFNIDKNSDILGTLYNIEDVDSPIEPHDNPESNGFGKGVAKNYSKVKKLLDI